MKKDKKKKKKKKSILPSSSKIINIDSNETDDNIELSSDECYFTADFLVNDIFDFKEYNRFIKNVEKHVRTSDEYTSYIGYLKSIGLTSCTILGNVIGNDEIVKIEMHHHPFTLYDICSILFRHNVNNSQPMNTFRMAKEVLDLHFENLIGLVPLSITVHQLVHAGEIIITADQVFGYIDKFISRYKNDIDEDLLDKYNQFIENTSNRVTYSQNDVLRLSKKIKNVDKAKKEKVTNIDYDIENEDEEFNEY